MKRRTKAMLSTIPYDLKQITGKNVDKEILRAAIIAEFDAVNLYEQMASLTENPTIQAVLLDIAKEEKTHVGEFQALLTSLDQEHLEELEKGQEEVQEIKTNLRKSLENA